MSSSAVYPFASPIADQQLDMQCGISNNQDLPVRTNHKIVKQLFIEPNSYLTGASVGRSIYNQDFMSPDSVINLSYQLEDAPVSFSTQTPTLLHHMYVYKKNLNQPYKKDILGGYEFEKMSPIIYIPQTPTIMFFLWWRHIDCFIIGYEIYSGWRC